MQQTNTRALEEAMAHTISGDFIDDVYVISLLHAGEVVRRFATTSPAVAGAAAFLLEKSPDPQALGAGWEGQQTTSSPDGVISLDCTVSGSATLGDDLVAQAEAVQMAQRG
jgi:hypothetical protein